MAGTQAAALPVICCPVFYIDVSQQEHVISGDLRPEAEYS